MSRPTIKVTIEFKLEPDEYAGIHPRDENELKSLVKAMMHGEADWPPVATIKIQPDDAGLQHTSETQNA